MEDTLTADPWVGERPEDLANMDPAELAKLTPQELEQRMGIHIGDRSRDEAPAGDAPVHEMQRKLESGEAVHATEEILAATALQDLEQKQQPSAAASAKPPESVAAPTQPTAAPEKTTPAAEEPEVVESRDGKGKIPYSVLQAARARTAELEAENAELRGVKQRQAEDAAVKGALTDEQIAALRDSFPDAVVDAMVALNNDNIELKKKNLELSRSARSSDDLSPEQKAAQAAQDAIDQDETLAGWQNDKDQTNWQRAVAFDDMLSKDPVWKAKPFTERIGQVKTLMGVAPPPTPQSSADAAAQAIAAASAAAAAAAQPRAFSHSDMPGGSPPAQNEQQRIENLDIMALAGKVDAMNSEQMSALLSKFG
jgi:hypothetical protein